jgi:hypothetical protein
MKLNTVTITGADDSTDPKELVALSEEFPFVEWGILVSKGHIGGSYRFPSTEWIDKFVDFVYNQSDSVEINVCTHICGDWVRKLLMGDLDWEEIPNVIDLSRRIQINTHSQPHLYNHEKFLNNLREIVNPDLNIIFQQEGVNDHLILALRNTTDLFDYATVLFDKSAGAGILPDYWPTSNGSYRCGYAGGLGPSNVVEQITRIQAANEFDFLEDMGFWIDMERQIRTLDDSKLDLNKVREVLRLTEPFIEVI